MDTKSEAGFELLIKAVLAPKDERNYGTLVYAMAAFDCGDHTDTIIELMRRNDFEVLNTASVNIWNRMRVYGETMPPIEASSWAKRPDDGSIWWEKYEVDPLDVD